MTDMDTPVGDAVKAMLDMAPDVAREMIAWDIGAHSAGFALFAAMTAACIYGMVRCFRARGDDMTVYGVVLAPIALLLAIGIVCEGHNALQAIFAPRAYLVEKALHR